LGQAFTQQVSNATWEVATMPRTSTSFTLPNTPDPGEAFVGTIEPTLLGLELANPQATWPTSYTDPAITWRDQDGDGQPGVTSVVPTTGTSSSCRLPYAALPIPSSGELVTRAYTGSRSLASLSGTIGTDCNTISGNLTGPASGPPRLEGHVVGCLKSTGSACTAAETASLDAGTANAQRITGARFTMVRVPDATTCSQVRATSFP
jgi:hypothetical protein